MSTGIGKEPGTEGLRDLEKARKSFLSGDEKGSRDAHKYVVGEQGHQRFLFFCFVLFLFLFFVSFLLLFFRFCLVMRRGRGMLISMLLENKGIKGFYFLFFFLFLFLFLFLFFVFCFLFCFFVSFLL